MTKDAQIRLLCEQQDQLNEEAREYKAEIARLTAELAAAKRERDNWQLESERQIDNVQFYRGLVVQIGTPFGIAS